MKWKGIYLLLLPTLTTFGCSKNWCYNTYPPKEHHTIEKVIERHDTTIIGATVHDTITLERFNTLYKDKVIVKQDTLGRAELRIWKDAYGRLRVECEAKDRKVTIENTTIKDVLTKVFEKEKKVVYWWIWMIIGIMSPFTAVGLFHVVRLIVKLSSKGLI